MKYLHTFLILLFFSCNKEKNTIGESVKGNFNENERKESAVIKQLEDKTYIIQFSKKTKDLLIGCCPAILINEGNLLKDSKQNALTVYQHLGGNINSVTTYIYKNDNWNVIVSEYLLSTGVDKFTNEELQGLIFSERDTIYYKNFQPHFHRVLESEGKHSKYNDLKTFKVKNINQKILE